MKALYVVLLTLTLYFYLNFVLGQFPWTRGFAVRPKTESDSTEGLPAGNS